MAQSGRDIRRRMQSVKNTQQITKAMEMIAAVKLRRAQERVERTRPYREHLQSAMYRVLAAARREGEELPEIASTREGGEACLVVVTSDRGLAGGYNANVLRRAEGFLGENPDCQLILVGKKARDYFRRRNRPFLADYVYLGDDVRFGQAQEIARVVSEFYQNGLFSRVHILYTQFLSTISHRVMVEQILPIEAPKREERGGIRPLYWFEPSVGAVIHSMVPLYIDTMIYQGLLEAIASEQGSRMTAMRNATDNAGELIEQLNLSYNRARQGAITTELSEIVGGAEALES